MNKAVIIGVVSFVVFLLGNILIGNVVGIIIPGGDDFINSYFFPLYAGVNVLISLVISCTYIMLKKLIFLLRK